MSSVSQGTVFRQLDRLFLEGTVTGLTEGELLGRFARRGDEAAFEALIARHGPMVLGVCRRILPDDPHAAEDAFQAVFLILVKKAGSIRDGDRLGPWLHGVARRVALRARAHALRRRSVERPGAEDAALAAPHDGVGTGPGGDPGERAELRAALDAEVDRLPEKYRAPVVLCYLEGLTHDEAAHRLGWPVGTVRSRMAWARDKLRHRLTRRGLAVPAGLVAAALGSEPARAAAAATAPAVPSALLQSTLRAAMHLAADETLAIGAASGAGIVSGPAAELARGVLQNMLLHKFKIASLAVLTLGATAGGGLAVALQDGPGRGGAAAGGGGSSEEDASPEVKRLRDQLRRIQAQEEALQLREAELRKQLRILRGELAELRGGAAQGVATEVAQDASASEGSTTVHASAGQQTTAASSGSAVAAGTPTGQRTIAATASDGGAAVAMPGGQQAVATTGRATAKAGGRGVGRVAVAAPGGSTISAGQATAFDGSAPTAASAGFGQSGGAASFGGGGFGPGSTGVSTTDGAGFAPGPGGLGGFGGGIGPGGVVGESSSMVMSNSIISVQPRDSRKVFAYSTETGAWKGYSLPEGVEASPIISGSLLALLMKGEAINQVAAFDPSSGAWYAQDLKEPAKGKTQPIVAGNLAAYGLGRHVYAFSSDARRWDVLTLPEGSAPATPVVHSAMVVVERGGKLYTFSAKTGRWTEFDTQTGE